MTEPLFSHTRRPGHRPGRDGLDHPAGLASRGRKLSAEDLQWALLAMLEREPAHGYQLIKRLAEHSSGLYAPSPGMVYPALAALTDADFLLAEPDGAKKRYGLTPAGRRRLEENREHAAAILDALRTVGARMALVRRVFEGGEDAESFAPGTPEDLMLARYALKRAVHDRAGCTPQEAARIAAILRHATAQILHGR